MVAFQYFLVILPFISRADLCGFVWRACSNLLCSCNVIVFCVCFLASALRQLRGSLIMPGCTVSRFPIPVYVFHTLLTEWGWEWRVCLGASWITFPLDHWCLSTHFGWPMLHSQTGHLHGAKSAYPCSPQNALSKKMGAVLELVSASSSLRAQVYCLACLWGHHNRNSPFLQPLGILWASVQTWLPGKLTVFFAP